MSEQQDVTEVELQEEEYYPEFEDVDRVKPDEDHTLSINLKSQHHTVDLTNPDYTELTETYIDEEYEVADTEIYEISTNDPSKLSSIKTSSDFRKCQYCSAVILSRSMTQHINRHHRQTFRFHCDHCGKGFRVKSDLLEHVKCHMNIASRPTFQCTHCPSKFLSKTARKNHINTFHSTVIEEHACDECMKVYPTRLKLKQHILSVHRKGDYKCEFCTKIFQVKYNLQKHKKKEHGEKEKCPECDKLVAPGRYMKEHLMQHDPPKFDCNFDGCEKKFHRRKTLQYHIDTQHQPVVESFICTLCSTNFNSQRNLNRHHQRQHGNAPRIACEVEGCTHTSARKDYLAAHYRNHKDLDQDAKDALLEKVKNMKNLPW